MQTIKKLILKEWLKSYLSSAFVLFLLISISNIVSEILRAAAPFSDILKHYALELPKWIIKIFPVSCLTAGLFSLSKLQGRGELMAIFACGYSRRNFITTILQVAGLIALIQFYCAGYLRPYAKSLRKTVMEGQEIHFRSNQSKGIKTSSLDSGKIWYKAPKYFCGFSAYDKNNKLFREIKLFYFDEQNHVTQLIGASKAKYLENNNWLFSKGKITSNLTGDNYPTVETFEQKNIHMSETPQDFENINSDVEQLNVKQLFTYIKKIEKLGINSDEYRIYFYQNFSDAFICIIFALISISAIFNPNRRNSSMAKNIFFTFCFTLIYWLLYSSTITFGISGKIPPYIAAFTIPFVCAIFVAFRFYKHRKL